MSRRGTVSKTYPEKTITPQQQKLREAMVLAAQEIRAWAEHDGQAFRNLGFYATDRKMADLIQRFLFEGKSVAEAARAGVEHYKARKKQGGRRA